MQNIFCTNLSKNKDDKNENKINEITQQKEYLVQNSGHNINNLVEKCGPYKQNTDFRDWVDRQETWLKENTLWLIEEIQGAGEGSGQTYEDMLLLNLRAWQYSSYGKPSKADLCSSFVMPLLDSTIALAGALDDSAEYYCGPVRITAKQGYSFITFPLTGTCWASRAHNSRGLSIGISSQHLPDIKKGTNLINQDIAVRIITQTCSTSEQVRDFCKNHSFTLNILCIDAQGKLFACHNTAAGIYEVPAKDACCVLTNHISDDEIIYKLSEKGVSDFPESKTSRARRGKLLEFVKSKQSRSNGVGIRGFLEQKSKHLAAIRNELTIYMTYSNPQKYPESFWILDCTKHEKIQWTKKRV